MTVTALIRDLADTGIRLSRNGDRLHVEAPKGKLTSELKLVLTEHKTAILAALSEPLADLRAKLERLADTIGADPYLVHDLHDDEIADRASLPDVALLGYVLAIRDSDLRKHGRVPAGETARALCRHCGPVWVHPAVASAAPVVGGWPRLLGCPWCYIRNRDAMPQPPVTCGECSYFARDNVNPDGGRGRCGVGCDPSRPWPNVTRQCATHTTKDQRHD